MKPLWLILFLLLSVGCINNNDTVETATFEVEGMVIRNGFLWLGWPENIGKALDALKGITTHKFENETQIFTTTFNPKKINKEQIIKAVESAEGDFTVINWEFHRIIKWNLAGAFLFIIFVPPLKNIFVHFGIYIKKIKERTWKK